MQIFFAVLGVGVILTVLWDAFETIVLPRRVTRKFRITRLFYRYSWIPWSALVGRRANPDSAASDAASNPPRGLAAPNRPCQRTR